MSARVLEVDGLSVQTAGRARSRQVLADIAFDIGQGETVCVVGESGSGKSVTALSIMGLLPRGGLAPTGGRILVDDEDVLVASQTRLRELRATRMAMVFQEPMTALNPVHRVASRSMTAAAHDA